MLLNYKCILKILKENKNWILSYTSRINDDFNTFLKFDISNQRGLINFVGFHLVIAIIFHRRLKLQ